MEFIDIQRFSKDIKTYNKLLITRYKHLMDSRVKDAKGLENLQTDAELGLIIKEIKGKVFELNTVPTVFQNNEKIGMFIFELGEIDKKGTIPPKVQIKRYKRFTTLLRTVIADKIAERSETDVIGGILIDKDILLIEYEIDHNQAMIDVLHKGNSASIPEQITIEKATKRMDIEVHKMESFIDILNKEAEFYKNAIKNNKVSDMDKNFYELSLFRVNKDIEAKEEFLGHYISRSAIIHEPSKNK